MKKLIRVTLSNMDIVTLKHIEDAEVHNSPVPPAFVNTLVRLSKAGFIHGDSNRAVKVPNAGHAYLRTDYKVENRAA